MKSFLSCAVMLIGLVACGAQATHAAVINDFTGAFAVGNWTITTPQGSDGFVTLNGPTSVTVASGANSVGGNTDFSIIMPFAGTVTFDWSFATTDLAGSDPFSVGSNGNFTKLTSDTSGSPQSSSYSVSLLLGQVFAFRASSIDGMFGRSETTITNFMVTYADSGAVPEPTSMAIFGLGALGVAYRQRRKNKS
jgi:hypothetical protein